jgi:hypothetical protein
MVIEGEHLGLLVALILLVLLAMRIECVLRLLWLTCGLWAAVIILLLLFVLLIKEGKIVRILTFALARIRIVSLIVLSGGD